MSAYLTPIANAGPLNPNGRHPGLLALASTGFPGKPLNAKSGIVAGFSKMITNKRFSAAQVFSWINDLFRDYNDITLFESLPKQIPALYGHDPEKTFLLAKAIIEKMPLIVERAAAKISLYDLESFSTRARGIISYAVAGFARVAQNEQEKIQVLRDISRSADETIRKIYEGQIFSYQDEAPAYRY